MSHDINKLERLATWMDSRFQIPGTSIRFGLDSILGLIPGIGDSITVLSNGYIIAHAHKMGIPISGIIHMVWNVFVDWLIGIIPLVGDVFDIGWKANLKNIEILKKHTSKIKS